MNTYTNEEFTYNLLLSDNILKITITNNLMYCEYSMEITNDSEIFQNHTIIKDVEILHKILCDAFEKNFDVNVRFNINDDKYEIRLNIETTYVKDEITLSIPLTKEREPPTPKQIIDDVDGKFRLLTEYTNTHLRDIIKEQHKQEEAQKELIQMVNNHAQIFIILQKQITELKHENEQLKYSFTKYITAHPIMTVEKKSKNIFKKDHVKIKNIMSDIPELTITYHDHNYYAQNEYKIVNFTRANFNYLTKLKHITFDGCPFTNLDFLNCASTLKTITIKNMPTLKQIKWLSSCVQIEKVILIASNNIEDIEELKKCRTLKYVSNNIRDLFSL
jgi:hypothetical protein